MQKSQRAQRMQKRHKRAKRGGALNLVSMMDIFTILVFFLLVNSSDVEQLSSPGDIQLPQSIAEDKPRVNVVVLIGNEQILVQGQPVADVAAVLAAPGHDIPGLREALLEQNDRELGNDAENAIGGREVTIMGDKDISYRVLKKVMATCTASDYGKISLAVLQKSTEQFDQVAAVR